MPGPSSSCILRSKPDPVCGYRIMRSGTDWEDVGERMRVARLAASRKLSEPAAGSLLDALRATGLSLPRTGAEFPRYARQHGLL